MLRQLDNDMQINELGPRTHTIHKNENKMYHRLNTNAKIIKILFLIFKDVFILKR